VGHAGLCETKQGGQKMAGNIWVMMTAAEKALLLEVLSSITGSMRAHDAEIDALNDKLNNAELHPNITVRLANGQFQCASGNPVPIRICDYDGFDLPDVDEHGKPCEIIWEPADEAVADI
jgi:hypothetical protein